jgi:tRNA A-37 threonylcarbamoyl transferase component Bud32
MTHALSAELLDLQAAVAGRYSIEREIGRGGMGVVFLARDVALERPVAIKLLPRHLAQDAALRERFIREARTAAALMHPNVVPIHSVEAQSDLAYFVMAFVEGETLTARVARTGVLKGDDATRLMQEVAWALGYAHGRGVVHRDIKPDNILIEHASGRAMVADFGIARVASQATLSAEGAFVGTMQYMSPEQASAEELDGRSDIYSLAATMYFALTGVSPVEAPTLPAMLAKLMTEEPTPLASLRPELPSVLMTTVTRSLQKDRSARFNTADEVAMSLRDAGLARTVRPDVRAFLREVSAGMTLLVAGIGGASVGAALVAGRFLPRGALPFMAVLGFVSLFLSVVSTLGGLAQLRRLSVPWSEVDDGIRAGLREFVGVSGNLQPDWARVRLQYRWIGGVALAVSGSLIWKGWTELARVPLIAELYLKFGGAVAVFGTAILGLSFKRVAPPQWLWGGEASTQQMSALDPALHALRYIMRWKWAQRMYSKGIKTQINAPPSALPTATLLLQRVEELVSNLPEAMRARLGDVLPAAAGLERAINALRSRLAQLDRAITELRPSDPALTEFAAARARVAARLTESVSALERVRTDLLRLSAGLIAADGITAELEKAQQLSAAIDAELHGLDAVRQLDA